MPDTAVNRRRGTTAQHAAFTGLVGETTYDTDLKRLVAHDGALAGGFPAAALHLAQTFAQTQTITPLPDTPNLVLSGGVVTGAGPAPFFNLTGEWNTAGSPTAFLVDILNTASAGTTLLFDWRVGGNSSFSLHRNGTVSVGPSGAAGIELLPDGSAFFANLAAGYLEIAADGQVLWAGGISSLNIDGSLLASGPTSFFGNTTNPDNVIAFQNPVGVGTNTLDFRTNGTLDANFLRKYNTTPFQIELAASGNLDFVIDSRNVSTGTSVRFITNGIRDSGLQTVLATFFDNGTNELTNRTTVTIPALAATTAAGYSLVNSTAAAVGAQQVSPALQFEGFGWKTDPTAASQSVRWRQFLNPVQGTATATAQLVFQTSVNAAAFTSVLTLSSAGSHTLTGNLDMTGNLGSIAVLTLASTGTLTWANRATITSPADGVLRLTNNAQTDWTRLAFGGTTAAFPAIGRNGVNLEILGADGAGPSGLFIYNTKTSATNFERLDIQWTANTAQIFTEAGSGGGTARDLILGANAIERLRINVSGAVSWGIGDSDLGPDGSLHVDVSTTLFSAEVSTQIVTLGNIFTVDVAGAAIGFFSVGPSAQQDVIPLTNSVTPGGTVDTLDDFSVDSGTASLGADLMDQATIPDKSTLDGILATLQGDLYQLGRKVNQIITSLDAYGLLAP